MSRSGRMSEREYQGLFGPTNAGRAGEPAGRSGQ
jgi:hypothetical protein